jgi:predicted nucleic acid-binding protein
MASILIQDACVLLNLLASGRFADVAGGCGLRFAVVSEVSHETLYVRDAISGEHERIDLQLLIERQLLEVFSVKGQAEQLRYIELAVDLDDGEAASIAIAEARGLALATDDKKARALIQRKAVKIELWTTFELLRHWQAKARISDRELASVLINIANRARFLPKPGHPEFAWWTKLCSSEKSPSIE